MKIMVDEFPFSCVECLFYEKTITDNFSNFSSHTNYKIPKCLLTNKDIEYAKGRQIFCPLKEEKN